MRKTITNRMLAAAQKASRSSYAPYSGFRVGAAVLDERGRIHPGCNVENASFGLAICAERVAVFRAVSAGARAIKAALVYTDTEDFTPPCGACLQVLSEFGERGRGGELEVILASRKGLKRFRFSELLPNRFRLG